MTADVKGQLIHNYRRSDVYLMLFLIATAFVCSGYARLFFFCLFLYRAVKIIRGGVERQIRLTIHGDYRPAVFNNPNLDLDLHQLAK